MRKAVVAGAVVLVVLVAGLVWLLRDDSDGDKDDTAAGETTGELTASQVFAQDDVPFTFEYPGTFAPVPGEDLPRGYLAILGVGPVNFIDVRLTANEELTDEEIVTEIGGALEQPGIAVLGQSTREVAGTTVVVFQVSDTTSGELALSSLRFLRAGGRTWELGCQWDETGAATIAPACEGVLGTLTLTAPD